MRFSEVFGLRMAQPQLDFVDIHVDRDNPLYLDPYSFALKTDEWSTACTADITFFFQKLLNALIAGDDATARALCANLHEPNETCLGQSKGLPRGRGVGSVQSGEILGALRASRAIGTGMIQDITDAELFVEGVGPDKVSDLTTNLIRHRLIEYTQQQCAMHGIPMETVASGPLWSTVRSEWLDGELVSRPVYNHRAMLLVPRFAVRLAALLEPHEYYRHHVLNYIKMQEQSNPLSRFAKVLKSGERRIIKSALESDFPYSKGFLLDFSIHNPDVLERYRKAKTIDPAPTLEELESGFDERMLASQLIVELGRIPSGPADADAYHRFIIGLLSFLFYPNLAMPIREDIIHDGRKIIDVTYVNTLQGGLFQRFPQAVLKPAPKIIVECKNYTDDPTNPAFDQLAGRFGPRGWLGLLLCRTLTDRARAVARCRDTVRDGRGYMIPLDDSDIQAMLRHVESGNRPFVNGHLERIFSDLLK